MNHLNTVWEIRLFGIDAPEKDQEYGQKARDLTSALVAGRNIEVEQKDIDSYGRIVALVKVDGQDLNELIVRNGFAWVYRHHCTGRFCTDWIKSEMVARKEKKGMWSDPHLLPPREWRQQQKERPEEKTAPHLVLGRDKAAGTPSSGGQYRCDGRTHCSQMTSCEEATFFLRNCPGTQMDGNNDGVSCERQWCN